MERRRTRCRKPLETRWSPLWRPPREAQAGGHQGGAEGRNSPRKGHRAALLPGQEAELRPHAARDHPGTYSLRTSLWGGSRDALEKLLRYLQDDPEVKTISLLPIRWAIG